jgi:hypothetical protein
MSIVSLVELPARLRSVDLLPNYEVRHLIFLVTNAHDISTSRKNQAQSQLAPQLPPPDAIKLDLATIDLLTSETT